MSDTIENLEWAINTIRDGVTFGRDELGAAKARETRAKGVMIEAVKELTQLREALKEISVNLNVCKNDYWFMSNLLEKYSTDKQQAINDCAERMKLRKPIFNVLSKHKDLIDKINKENER